MASDDGTARGGAGRDAKAERERRLAEALRRNLMKRKAQARGRRAGEADQRAGLAAARPDDHKPDGSGQE
ncbi:hypothetical protein [Pleomorphomonas carboxyditropha]|uniref:Uncharacterized protein n=1 Tax=Pleomorphomonas carboxyditropha TaxID=2023338 RepID=A0A2G9WQM3_9HYPH|nr:hypothetical protein [Pleomorphomonas carboxyditropha]PIO97029.1 hypothetical protein CJ014_22270 [Pleomorphomonas carboxyditropha]